MISIQYRGVWGENILTSPHVLTILTILAIHDIEDEKKTRFTAYSMSSSIMRRSVKLENLDDHFEEFFAKFDEDEIGALPHKNLADNEVELDSELLQNMMQQDYETFIPKVISI